jgi:signal transduction histidine kinase
MMQPMVEVNDERVPFVRCRREWKGRRMTSEAQRSVREAALEDSVAEIVHDLKSPLAAISLEAMLLDDRMQRGEREQVKRAIERISSNVAFLDRLIVDVLDACELAAGPLVLRRETTELRDLLEQVIERIVPASQRARVYLDAAVPVTLSLDPHRIERVVANLLDNALKYTPENGGIIVRLTVYNGCASVSVIDSGAGLGDLEQSEVFSRYRRGESARGRRGSGLGLHVSKKIIEAHGGQIGVESIRGAGARFYFDLPAR